MTKFKVIDITTGREVSSEKIDKIAKENGLMHMDIDQFFIGEDGQLVLALWKEVANIESIMVKRPFICKKCGASFERTLPRFTSIYPLCDKCMSLKAQEEPIMLSCVERS